MLTNRTLREKEFELKVNAAYDNTEAGVIKFEITGSKSAVDKMVKWLEYKRVYGVVHKYKENYIEG